MSSVLPTGVLWSEKYITITPKIGIAFTISGLSLHNVLQAIVGIFIVDYPMLLIYINAFLLPVCLLLFLVATMIGHSLVKDKNEAVALLSNATDGKSKTNQNVNH